MEQGERAYITSQLQRIEKKLAVQLVALCEGTVVGVAEVDMKDLVEQHVGTFGISIAKAYRGEGIGALLMETGLDFAFGVIRHLCYTGIPIQHGHW
jgi:predicted N-acetyltransferase YhbS